MGSAWGQMPLLIWSVRTLATSCFCVCIPLSCSQVFIEHLLCSRQHGCKAGVVLSLSKMQSVVSMKEARVLVLGTE